MAFNVLVVDDSAVMRAMIIKTLRMSGVPLGEIYQAGNGQEGLEALEGHGIDLSIVDINMPVMDGEEMIERMKINPKAAEIPILVVSTEGSQTRIDRLEENGAKFIQKPFEPESIRDVISQITEGG